MLCVLLFFTEGLHFNFDLLQICIESMWGLLGMLDMNQLLQEAADDSESTSTGTDPSPSSPPQVYPSMQQVQFQGPLWFIHTCDLLGVNYCVYFSDHAPQKWVYNLLLSFSVHTKVDQIASVYVPT